MSSGGQRVITTGGTPSAPFTSVGYELSLTATSKPSFSNGTSVMYIQFVPPASCSP